ncbi:hypothetical protein J6590_064958 [Homalodisca vitripennis]|nr:hypothetical protein J6590_064958 [Homalodisca vitripennis]
MLEILTIVVGLSRALACNQRYANEIVQTHINLGPIPKCKPIGEKCKYDRNCCEGLECTLHSSDFNMDFVCLKRRFGDDYNEFQGRPSWKDYQELEPSEEVDLNYLDVDQLKKANENLRMKISELKMLRKSVRQQQMMDLRRKLQEAEVAALKEEQRHHIERFNQDVDRLKQKELEDQLLNLERKEVNHTLFKQQRVADLYMDMLAELADKGNVNKPNP